MQQHDFFFFLPLHFCKYKRLGAAAKVSFFFKTDVSFATNAFSTKKINCFLHLCLFSSVMYRTTVCSLLLDAFYEVIIMQMFSAWAVRHPQASKIGTTFSDEEGYAYFYYFNRSGNFANMSTKLMGLIFQVSISLSNISSSTRIKISIK